MSISIPRILFVIFLAGLAGCKGPEGPAGPAGAQLTGDIFGYIKLFDEQHRPQTDNRGVSVSIESSTYSATSDSSGKWILKNVKAGVYHILFSKSEYGTVNFPSFQFVGGGNVLLGTKIMGQKPTDRVSTAAADTTDGSFTQIVNFTGTLSGDSSYSRQIVAYVGSDSTVDSSRYPFYGAANTPAGSPAFFGDIYIGDLHNRGISRGMTVYVALYINNPDADFYINPSDGKEILSALSATRLIKTFVMP